MLTLGGAIGLASGIGVESLTGHVPTTYIFAGMGGFVAGCSRTPLTAMFLAFALTKNLLILKPLLITCIASFQLPDYSMNILFMKGKLKSKKKS